MDNTSKLGYAIQVLPFDKTIISKQNSITKYSYFLSKKNYCTTFSHRIFVDNMYDIFVAPFLSLNLVFFYVRYVT